MTLIPPSAGTAFAGLYGPISLAAGSPLAPLPNYSISVFESDGSTEATLYTARSGKTSTGSNVVTTNAQGTFSFYADPGIYVLSFNVAGTTTTLTVEVPGDYSDTAWNAYDVTGNETILSGDCVFVDLSSASATITLGNVTAGARFKVVRTDANFTADGYTCTVEMTTGDILGLGLASGASSIPLNSEGSFVEIIADGTNGHITAGAQDSGWLTPSFIGGWSDSGGDTFRPVAYRKIGNVVRWRGRISGGDNAGGITVIQTGFGPTALCEFIVPNDVGAAYSYIQVPESGSNMVGYYGGSYSYLGLDGIEYTTD